MSTPSIDTNNLAAGGLPVITDPDPVNDATFVYHVDLFLVALLACVVVSRLPQAIALFSSSDWYNGHFLRHVPYRRSTTIVQGFKNAYPPPLKGQWSEDSHSSASSHTSGSSSKMKRLDRHGAQIVPIYPTHIASCMRFVRPLVAPLRARIVPGYSVAQFLIMTIYFWVLIYASFYKSNLFLAADRTGWVAIAQLPFIFALSQKNNLLGWLMGLGYEKFNFLHRFAGRLIVLAANIHSIHYFYVWSLTGTFQQNILRPSSIWGLITLICVDLIFFFSTSFWRQKAYNIFLVTHIIGFILILPAAYLHKVAMAPYVFTCAGIMGFDLLFRLVKSRIHTATIRPISQLDLTRVEVHGINAGWRAGQHVRLRVLSMGMGWWGWTEIHPFTIASMSGGQEGLVLMCKKTGSWTKKLYEIAKEGGYTEGGVGRDIKVMIEGPYGGPGHTIFASFSGAVFVVGGSGITFALSTVQDLVQKDLKGQSRLKIIELIWVVQDPASLVPLLPTFTTLVQQSVFTPLHISVYYTRAAVGKFPFPPDFYHPGISLAPGRPRIAKVIDSTLCRAVSLGSGIKDKERIMGLVVGVCGPVELADDVVKAVGSVEPTRRDQVGGIEVHEEVFGW